MEKLKKEKPLKNNTMEIPVKGKRRFLPENIVLDSWNALKPLFEELKNRELNLKEELKEWMRDLSEVMSVLEEEKAWRYIRMNIDTRDEKLEALFNKFVREITPETAPYWNEFNKKLVDCEFSKELTERSYEILLRGIKSSAARQTKFVANWTEKDRGGNYGEDRVSQTSKMQLFNMLTNTVVV